MSYLIAFIGGIAWGWIARDILKWLHREEKAEIVDPIYIHPINQPPESIVLEDVITEPDAKTLVE